MEKTTTHSEHIGSIIEQWFQRFELIAKEDDEGVIEKGKCYPVGVCDMCERQIGIEGLSGQWKFYKFHDLPEQFEIRIREA